MTKVAFLGCGESADWVRSKGKRCCLSDFETPESAPRTRVKRGDFISFGYSRGEVIWIVLVSRAWWRQSFTYLCQAKKNDFDILGWTEESSLNITLVCHLNIQPPVQFLGWKQYIPTGLISASTLLQVSVFCLICNKKRSCCDGSHHILDPEWWEEIGQCSVTVGVSVFNRESCKWFMCDSSVQQVHIVSAALLNHSWNTAKMLFDRSCWKNKCKHEWEVKKKKKKLLGAFTGWPHVVMSNFPKTSCIFFVTLPFAFKLIKHMYSVMSVPFLTVSVTVSLTFTVTVSVTQHAQLILTRHW